MLNFQLLPGDKYDGRCAEIYITEKQFLVYHCSVCEEIFATFTDLLSHITKDHYENTKEYNEVETSRIVKTVATQENQLATTKSNTIGFDSTGLIKNSKEKEHSKKYLLKTFEEITDLKAPLDTEDLPKLLNSNKHLPLRKKTHRIVTGTLKNNTTIGKSKMNTLTRHPVNSNEDIQYICGICGFAFKEKYNFRCHLLRHSNQKKLSCSICQTKLFTKMELRLHETCHKGEKPYLCNHCGMGFHSWILFTQHIRKHHNSLQRSFKSEQCDKPCFNFHQLKDHQPVHLERCSYQCTACPLAFKCNKTLNNHMKLHENNRKSLCETCDLEFTNAIASKGRKEEIVINKDCNDKYMQDNDNTKERRIKDSEFILEQNFDDEYELVQTLTDLECNQKI